MKFYESNVSHKAYIHDLNNKVLYNIIKEFKDSFRLPPPLLTWSGPVSEARKCSHKKQIIKKIAFIYKKGNS